jgi:hypothetical protein
MPTAVNLPVDSVLTVTRPGDSLPVYYRNFLAVGFLPTASGSSIRSVLQRHHAIVIGGAPYSPPNGEYIVEVPDPGPTYAALESVARAWESESQVEHVVLITFREVWNVRARHSGGNVVTNAPAIDEDFDISRPPVPHGPLKSPADSSMIVRRPGGNSANIYYRNILELAFDDSTSGWTVQSILARYDAVIIGGGSFPGLTQGAYVIRVPDPGPSFEALQSLLARLGGERGVHFVRAQLFGVQYIERLRHQP